MPQTLYRLPSDWSVKTDTYRSRFRNWVSTPGFRNLPRRDYPVNSYHDEVRKHTQGYFSGGGWLGTDGSRNVELAEGYRVTGFDMDGYFNSNLTSSNWSFWSDNHYNDEKLKLLTKIADVKSNMAVQLAEAHKTAQMVEGACERIYQASMAVWRRDFRAAARILNIVEPSTFRHGGRRKGDEFSFRKNWLEFQYGWKPMLMDVKGTAEAFANQYALGGRPPAFVCSVRSNLTHQWDHTDTFTAYGGVGTSYATKRFSASQELLLKAWVEVDNPSLTALQQVGLTNPLLVAWEVVPYSFVFDWFISVGDWLTALTALNGLKVVKSMYSSSVQYQSVNQEQAATNTRSDKRTYFIGSQLYKTDDRDYVRRPIENFSALGVRPAVKNPFTSISRLVTSLALIQGKARHFGGQ